VARARVGRDDFLSFWLNGAWTVPLHATSGGALTCHGGEAVLTRVDVGGGETSTDAKLTHQRCTPTECQSKSMPVRDVLAGEVGLAPANPIQAVGLEGKLLIVWVAGQRGGVRMRLADVGEIPKTPDVILYDDLVQNGKVVDGSTLLDMKVLPAESFAVVLLATPAGVRALRVSSDGKFGAMKL
jgi:hypothetical protein